jgi:pyruvate dehydrogenase E2 component (dihydrolipoamide acetyltransferase)
VSDIAMPRLSDSMEEGTILSWLKQVGDAVAVGEELVEIETDKANMGYEADVAGTLLEIVVGENESAPVGAVIARIGDPQAAGPVTAGDPPSLPVAEASSRGVPPAMPPAAPTSANHARIRISPLARRAASRLGVELDGVEGSGPYGRVMKADVEAASSAAEIVAAGPLAAPPERRAVGSGVPAKIHELSRREKVVARRMVEAKSGAPEFTLRATVEMSAAVELREEIKRLDSDGPKPSFNDFVVKAVALALRRHPRLNSGWSDGAIELYEKVNVGIAVADGDDLLVPVVADADALSIGRIAERTRGLAVAVKEDTVTPADLSGATFTVSNLGMFGIESFEAILNPPQAAILAVGAIGRTPGFDQAGELMVCRPMAIVLTCDHRIVYGAEGARFLSSVKELLEQPLRLLG